ncbi:MAG: hypothetical protein L3J69_09770 [Desulfobacula sp.]|nr:hypothetical protein [Desulfobacula sp.]
MGYLDSLIKYQQHSKYTKISIEANLMGPLFESFDDNEILSKIQNLKQSINRNKGFLKSNLLHKKEKQILIESIACYKELSKRRLGEFPYDEQVVAGIALLEGIIVDMPNGEGKTLAGAMAAFLTHLTNSGHIHIVTANDYLAQRDATWMGVLYHSLGMTVGILKDTECLSSSFETDDFQLNPCSTIQAYDCDVLYGSANKFIFNYLRNNLKFDLKEIININFETVIIDEIDSVLIDEARTPCIITEESESDNKKFLLASQLVCDILKKNEDYFIDHEKKNVDINQSGILKVEHFLQVPNIYDYRLLEDKTLRGFIPTLEKTLEAYYFYSENIDYFIENGVVVIIDELTGRPRYNSTFSNGLHQSIEVKHSLPPSPETLTIAKITFQKYFQKYRKLSGMSGTAAYDETEYSQIYGKDVIHIPSRFAKLRIEKNDLIFRTQEALFNSIVKLIQDINRQGQPILIGTITVDAAEKLANRLKSINILYELLHAKNHKREAEILKNAGKMGAVTLTAKMAGRGTDIKIEKEAEEKGGLFVLGIGRQESRRIDEQLKGRTARHGKSGEAQFALSLEDELLLIFGGKTIGNIIEKIGLDDSEALDHKFISKAINKAQGKVEKHNFLIRKTLYDYDDILDKHREGIYELRKAVQTQKNDFDCLQIIIQNIISKKLNLLDKKLNTIQFEKFIKELEQLINKEILNPFMDKRTLSKKEISVWAENVLIANIKRKKQELTNDDFPMLFQHIALSVIRKYWSKHLLNLDTLKSKTSMNIYRKMDFIDWYLIESNKLYDNLIGTIEEVCLELLLRIRIKVPEKTSLKEN